MQPLQFAGFSRGVGSGFHEGGIKLAGLGGKVPFEQMGEFTLSTRLSFTQQRLVNVGTVTE